MVTVKETAARRPTRHAGTKPTCYSEEPNGTFASPGFGLRLGQKDARLLLEAAAAVDVPMALANLIRDRFTASVNKGRGELDWSALAIEVFESAGLR
jgi:3-hydroxyisobutyrate dehydrogenase-like beta-hydroxyacid dehydrogenase